MRVLILTLCCMLSCFFVSGQENGVRDYYAALNSNEKNDIRFMINTLAHTSLIQLAFKQGELQKAGDRIAHIHPFRYFAFVITDPELSRSFKKINGMPWSRFRKGMANNFAIESQRNNIKEDVLMSFQQETGIDPATVYPYAASGQWDELLDSLKKNS